MSSTIDQTALITDRVFDGEDQQRMEIRLICGQCNSRYRVDSAAMGSYLKCKRCGIFIEITQMNPMESGDLSGPASEAAATHHTPIVEPEFYELDDEAIVATPNNDPPSPKNMTESEKKQSDAVAAWFELKKKKR